MDYTLKVFQDLLATTEGRDKLLKGAGAGVRVLAERSGSKDQVAFAANISQARSIMRLASWISNLDRIRALLANGSVSPTDFVMILRIVGDGVYSFFDNLAFIGKHYKWDKMRLDATVHRSFIGMFWGFFFAVLLDVHALFTMDNTSFDFKKTWRSRVLLLTRNFCDMLAALSNVKYLNAVALSATAVGYLGVISASISTFENWNKAAAKVK